MLTVAYLRKGEQKKIPSSMMLFCSVGCANSINCRITISFSFSYIKHPFVFMFFFVFFFGQRMWQNQNHDHPLTTKSVVYLLRTKKSSEMIKNAKKGS